MLTLDDFPVVLSQDDYKEHIQTLEEMHLDFVKHLRSCQEGSLPYNNTKVIIHHLCRLTDFMKDMSQTYLVYTRDGDVHECYQELEYYVHVLNKSWRLYKDSEKIKQVIPV